MESHSICVWIPDHLAEDIHLLCNIIDVIGVLLGELLQHVSGLGLRIGEVFNY